MIPRPYQARMVEKTIAALKEKRNTLAVAPTGAGKTIIMSMLAGQLQPAKTLILQHRDELVSQNLTKFRKVNPSVPVGLYTADTKSWRGQVTFAMVQTLARDKNLTTIPPLDLLLVDECFPAGTMVAGREIQNIRMGDMVTCFDHEIKSLVERPITHIFHSKPSGMVSIHLSDGTIQRCTPGHPFFVLGHGYIHAIQLQKGDALVKNLSIPNLHLVSGHDRESHQSAERCSQSTGHRVLLQDLQLGKEEQRVFLKDGGNQPQACLGTHETQQPHEQARMSRQNVQHFESDWTSTESQGRKWEGPDPSSNNPPRCHRGVLPDIGDGHSYKNQERERVPNLLQGRHSHSRLHDSHRYRWRQSLFIRQASTGHQEGLPLAFVWVDRIEIHQPTSDGTFGGMCPDGYVYNVEVAGCHNYFANGILVHNCHHVAAKSYLDIIAAVKDRNPACMIGGVTATPARGDKKGLRDVFSNVADQITLRELIQGGYLVHPRTFVIDVGTQQELKGVRKLASDFDMDQVEGIMNRKVVNDEVVTQWQEKAGDRKTIVFCSTIQHAEDVTQAFRDAGVMAELVSGETPSGERAAILRRLKTGETQMVVNVAVLTEGFDEPSVSCIVLLRPCSYKSTMIQMIGRGLRTVNPEEYPGLIKLDCVIMDFGTSVLTHGNIEADALLDDRRTGDDDEEQEQPEARICPECEMELPPRTRVCPVCGYAFSAPKEEGDILENVSLTELDILAASPFAWVDLFGSGKVMIASGFTGWAGIFSPDGTTWWALGKTKEQKVLTKIMIGARQQAMTAADDFLRDREQDSAAQKTRRWLKDPATDKQRALLSKVGYQAGSLDFGWTKYSATCHLNFQWHRRLIEGALGVR